MKKWKIEVLAALIIAIGGGGFWGVAATGPQRKAMAEYKSLVAFSKRQAVEIAVIEQAAKLAGYKKQMAEKQPVE